MMVFSVLGTPNEEVWPGVSQLPDYKPSFPKWNAVDLERAVPSLDSHGIDLLAVSESFALAEGVYRLEMLTIVSVRYS